MLQCKSDEQNLKKNTKCLKQNTKWEKSMYKSKILFLIAIIHTQSFNFIS